MLLLRILLPDRICMILRVRARREQRSGRSAGSPGAHAQTHSRTRAESEPRGGAPDPRGEPPTGRALRSAPHPSRTASTSDPSRSRASRPRHPLPCGAEARGLLEPDGEGRVGHGLASRCPRPPFGDVFAPPSGSRRPGGAQPRDASGRRAQRHPGRRSGAGALGPSPFTVCCLSSR